VRQTKRQRAGDVPVFGQFQNALPSFSFFHAQLLDVKLIRNNLSKNVRIKLEAGIYSQDVSGNDPMNLKLKVELLLLHYKHV